MLSSNIIATSRKPVSMPARAQRSRATRVPKQHLLRVTMREIDPPIWRLVRVPDAFTPHQLHRVLQIVFSRLDYHLYAFEVGERRFEALDSEAEYESEDATVTRLRDLELGAGSRFRYLYDFGDDWEHDVVVERLLPMPSDTGPDWSPRLIGGERAAPPEDAGGPHGYAAMLEGLCDPEHPEHEEYRQWVGPGYDPERFDAWSLDHALALVVAWGAI
jgi:Plasmid pRiA4b ORF-3-like protein